MWTDNMSPNDSGISAISPDAVTFMQQGSVDWVNLANLQVKLTVGILSRLSRAKLEAITYHGALYIFAPASLSDLGQERVNTAIRKSTRYPTFSKGLWLGFGVKHIIHDFAVSQEGLACVGVCAALNEHFSVNWSASVISEMWKLKKLPPDYSPALHQWGALVEACSGTLAATDFPLLLGQMTKQYRNDGVSNIKAASPPKSVAAVLHTLLEAPRKNIREVHITGGCDCAWIGAVAHWLLQMSVEFVDSSGAVRWTSLQQGCSSQEHQTKLVIVQSSAEAEERMEIIKRCHVLGGGHSLLPGRWDNETRGQMVSMGRVSWASCLTDTFGTPAKKLLSSYGEITGWCLGSVARAFESYMCNEYCESSVRPPPPNSTSTARGFVLAAKRLLPEVRGNAALVESMEHAAGQTLNGAQREFATYTTSLRAICACGRCKDTTQPGKIIINPWKVNNDICLVQLILFIITLVRTTSSVRMPQELSISPSITGMEQLYWDHTDMFYGGSQVKLTKMFAQDTLADCAMLFGCEDTQSSIAGVNSRQVSALSANGLCCYLNTICNATASPEEATIVHIIPGRVYLDDFAYEKIIDDPEVLYRDTTFFSRSAEALDSYDNLAWSNTEVLESVLKVVEMVDHPRVLSAHYEVLRKNKQDVISFGARGLYTAICNAYTASDCRGKECLSANGIRSIRVDGDGWISHDVLSPLGPWPIIRVLPAQSLSVAIALTQIALREEEVSYSRDPKRSKLPKEGATLRTQLQGNQCVRCSIKNAMEGPRTMSTPDKPVRCHCILTNIRGMKVPIPAITSSDH
ncbi:hypothetical protein F5Y16DRAFT_289520 [Xylariaceae sp. FL0255]|nr:hypothetical protein F5Y16DRAFT_289520 [Xylariaceae sp. FL0255]